MQVPDKYLFSHPSEIDALREALAGRWLSGTAQAVDRYELALRTLFGSRHAIAMSSGSGALHCALHALGATTKKVLVSAVAPIPTLLPIITAGATPLFVDCEKDNFNFDLEDLSRCINDDVVACLSVQLWGYPCLSNGILELLQEQSIPLIEDAAHAHLTREATGLAGTLGRIGCFSTHDRKLLATGEGGFCITNDDCLTEQIRRLVALGLMDGVHHGFNYKLSALQASLGTFRLQWLDWQVKKRTATAQKLMSAIDAPNFMELSIPANAQPNYYNLVVRLAGTSSRQARAFIEALELEGVSSNILRYNVRPAYEYPLFAKWQRRCPNAEALMSTITTFPVHPEITDDHIAYIEQQVSAHRHLLVD